MKHTKATILLNDKDPVFLRVVKIKLMNNGDWEPLITQSFEEALNSIRDIQPELLVTDIFINDDKGRTGFDLINEIKKHSQSEKLKIVVLTDLAQDSDKEKAKDLGVEYYYVKSEISIKDFIDELKKVT